MFGIDIFQNLHNKKIGIWGFGVVGKSVLAYCAQQRSLLGIVDVIIWDDRLLDQDERALLTQHGSIFAPDVQSIDEFLSCSDVIIVSPGINTHEHEIYSHKFVCELDLFARAVTIPTIAITGTVGKTTTTELIAFWLSHAKDRVPTNFDCQIPVRPVANSRIALGGNIGYGMLDLISSTVNYDVAVLELSSFQLEKSHVFAPTIAIWTNLYPNHLDRHATLDEYIAAKLQLFCHQSNNDIAILSLPLLAHEHIVKTLKKTRSHKVFVSVRSLSAQEWAHELIQDATVFYVENNKLLVRAGRSFDEQYIYDCTNLPSISLLENWLTVLATLYICGKDLSIITQEQWQELQKASSETTLMPRAMLEHRIELVTNYRNIDFYNDSKSTVIEATIAAISRLSEKGRPIVLILGGLAKGVDRTPLLQFIDAARYIKKVYCFGDSWRATPNMAYHESLATIVADIFEHMSPGDQVLFSPSGASYDLFKHYKHRGDVFKELVMKHATNNNTERTGD